MPTIYLIGCGKAKRSETVAARDLYTGALFKKSLALAEAKAEPGDRVLILSALFGLVNPDDPLSPYEAALTDMPADRRRAWGVRVAEGLMSQIGGCPGLAETRVVIYAGKPYADAFRHGLGQLCRVAARIEEPLDTLQIGERLAWLNRAILRLNGFDADKAPTVHVP